MSPAQVCHKPQLAKWQQKKLGYDRYALAGVDKLNISISIKNHKLRPHALCVCLCERERDRGGRHPHKHKHADRQRSRRRGGTHAPTNTQMDRDKDTQVCHQPQLAKWQIKKNWFKIKIKSRSSCRNMSRIKSYYIHENMKRMTSCDYRALLRSKMSPQMSLDSPKGRHDQPKDRHTQTRAHTHTHTHTDTHTHTHTGSVWHLSCSIL